ncbi:MAG TPA: beta-ribofuranosylaminobenzene 5'-phosphate synthase family protein [Gemmatimonadaceae bacterium]|jgi:beta-RFAP synthase|nr:beta-ribofuranosylaminobenzene 5'-phosphate synthase family protein [Gemmatimonadaceae bacterium]
MADAHDGVFVQAPARLHFGMLDPHGTTGRRYGGIGAAVPDPSLLVFVTRDDQVQASGPAHQRARAFARTFLEYHGVRGGANIRILRMLPEHCGLGSGTQLALAVARALAELYDLPPDAASLARATGRAQRSAIGTWVFSLGGFILEGGRRAERDVLAPLLARWAMPAHWRCVLVVPPGSPGVSGVTESAAFARLPVPPASDVMQVARLVLLSLLPALVEEDCVTFGRALSEIQCINGRWFAPAQGGDFAPGASAALIARMRDCGAAGVGQSSWGPAVYGIVENEAAATALAAEARRVMADGGLILTGPFDNVGARVWRAPRETLM